MSVAIGTYVTFSKLHHASQHLLTASTLCLAGEIDKLSLDEAGIQNAVSVPDGAPQRVKNKPLPPPAADKAFSYLWQSQEYLPQTSRILLASDNDPPGHALAEELARRLGPHIRPWPTATQSPLCRTVSTVLHCVAQSPFSCIVLHSLHCVAQSRLCCIVLHSLHGLQLLGTFQDAAW